VPGVGGVCLHLVEADGVPGVGGVCLHLVDVLLLSSLSLCPFGIKIGANLNQGSLRNLSIFLPRGEGLLPPRQLLLPCQKLLLQILSHHHWCCSRRMRRPAQNKCSRSSVYQEVSPANIKNGQDPTCSPRTPSGSPPPSLSYFMVAIGYRG
jgi:hypothetical protein